MLSLAAILLGCSASVASARTAYFTNFLSATVTPLNTTTNATGSQITVGSTPVGVAITPDATTAFVASQGSPAVTPITLATNTAGTQIPIPTNAQAIAIAPDGETAYVTSISNDNITPIDLGTRTAGPPITVAGGPTGIAITPDGATAYVVTENTGTVTPVDLATAIAGTPISVTNNVPRGIAITPDGATVYVSNAGAGTVTPIDTATNIAGTPITVGFIPHGIAITPDGATAYVANSGDGTVTPINTATNTPGPAIVVETPRPVEAIAITPDGATAYVTRPRNVAADFVSPIDTATNTAGTEIPATNDPYAIAMTPDQPPDAAFSVPSTPVDSAASFDASASTDSDGSIASYAWDFGDGDTTTTSIPTTSHLYAAAGTYTATVTLIDNEGCSTAFVFTGMTASCNGSSVAQVSHQVTVTKLSPTLTASASADVPVGGMVGATATLGAGHTPTGNLNFKLYGPDDPTCSGAPVYTSTMALSGNGTYGSGSLAPATAGVYRWTVSYAGDASNDAISVVCDNDVAHRVTVAKLSPTLTASTSPDVAFGGEVHTTAVLGAAHTPTGNLNFKLYGPDDPTCAGAPVFTSAVALAGNGTYDSDSFAPTGAGVYRSTVSYAGDANNNGVSVACGNAVEVAQPIPPATDTTPPETIKGEGPKKTVKTKGSKAKVTFEFSSSESGSSFECSLDDASFQPCASPTSKKLKPGKHTFEIAATDPAGNRDQTPATFKFKVKRKR